MHTDCRSVGTGPQTSVGGLAPSGMSGHLGEGLTMGRSGGPSGGGWLLAGRLQESHELRRHLLKGGLRLSRTREMKSQHKHTHTCQLLRKLNVLSLCSGVCVYTVMCLV